VPLHGEQPTFAVLDHLDETILCPAGLVEVIPDHLDSLMVDRIHVELLAADEFCEQRFRCEADVVNCFVAPARLGVPGTVGAGEVLTERPTERDVHQFGASTDSKDRNPALDGGRDEGELTSIPFVVDIAGLSLETRSVPSRRDITAAGEEQSVDAFYGALREFGGRGWDE
jgi:hypothetical protein